MKQLIIIVLIIINVYVCSFAANLGINLSLNDLEEYGSNYFNGAISETNHVKVTEGQKMVFDFKNRDQRGADRLGWQREWHDTNDSI